MRPTRPPQVPGQLMNPFEVEQKGLAIGAPNGVIAVGSTLSDVDLLEPVWRGESLCGDLGESWGVVVFYRGVWCPCCNIALRTN
jgi:hypothetical protein